MTVSTRSRRIGALGSLVAVGALLLGACTNDDQPVGTPSAESRVSVDKVESIAALLPDAVRSSGTLRVGVNTPYSPNEFKDASGQIVGYDVDLVTAVASVLGLRPQFNDAAFDRIIPAVQQGGYDMGMSSFTDTKAREQTVDFVTYFRAGSQWVAVPGANIDPENACGKRVAVQTTTTQDETELPARNAKCLADGNAGIDIQKYDSQDDAANAVVLGKADAMSADSLVSAYAVKQSNGKLAPVGELFDAAPYGLAVQKGSALGPAVQQALKHLIEDGAYRKIAENWGVEQGIISDPVINGATE